MLRAVLDTEPGSLTGWHVFTKRETTEKAKLRMQLYTNSIGRYFPQAVLALIVLVKCQRRIRDWLWMPGGALYRKQQKETMVGKPQVK